MKETVEEIVKGHRDAITIRRVFGEPYVKNGVTVIPAAKVVGGGGGGVGRSSDGTEEGSGTGFGLSGKPVGVYVIKGDEVRWVPAFDVNRVIAGSFALAAIALLVTSRR
jgi:uncharacterized spore protein YtfJ